MSALKNLVFASVLVVCIQAYSYPQQEYAEDTVQHWPTSMTFSETKTNYSKFNFLTNPMLGEALLKRLYTRIEGTENLIRLEMSRTYEKLKSDIEKNIRKCNKKRRRAANGKQDDWTKRNKDTADVGYLYPGSTYLGYGSQPQYHPSPND